MVQRGISFFHQNQVTLFHSGSGRDAFDPNVLVLSSGLSLLMAMMQVCAGVLHLAKSFTLVSSKAM